jgi:methylglutaconyl-CoA hydratase
MMSGHVFSASHAKEMGLVHQVCDQESLPDHKITALNWFKETGPLAVQNTKKLIHQIPTMDWKMRRATTSQLIAELRTGSEGQEGLSSFLEKRKPSWRLP